MDEILDQNNMAANEVEIANPQTTEEIIENPSEVQGEEQVVDPVAEVTETKAFAQRLKEKTQEAIDAEYARLYGEYGIKSKTEYEAYLEKQRIQEEAIQNNVDPELYEKVVTMEKELMQYRTEKTMLQQEETLSKDPVYGSFFNENKDAIKDLSQTFDGELRGNLDVAMTVYMRQNFNKIVESQKQLAEQTAVQKIIQNQKTSPGSLASGADYSKSAVGVMSRSDFKALQEQVLRGERKSL